MQHYPMFPAREILNLNGVWDFNFIGDAELESLNPANFEFNDLMPVPGAFDCTPTYYCKRGVALYRTTFRLDHTCCNTWIKLDGIGLRGRFWMDGEEIGSTALPYSALEFDCASMAAGPHTFTAAIDNRFDPEKMKLFLPGFDFYAFGGFYRGVSLHTFCEPYGFERVQVRTVDYRTGRVSLRFMFRGDVPEQVSVALRFNTEEDFCQFDLDLVNAAAELEIEVPDFKLWSPESPNLHTVEVITESDRIIERFGIRQVAAGHKIILLNGEPIYLKGFNRHESHPQFGPASPEQLMIEDLQNLKDLNCNFVRGAHYPQDPRFLDLCDRMGMLVWEESLGWGNDAAQMADPEFRQLQEEQTRIMVRHSINHPSVIIWGFLNEFASGTQEGYDICKQLVDTIKAEDNSRLVTFACSHVRNDICHDLVDIIAYNIYPGWIMAADCMDEPPETILPEQKLVVDYFRARVPADKPIMVSEMGCCAVYGQHDRAAAQWTEEFQAEYLEKVIQTVFGTDELCGLTIWQFNDAKSFLRKGANIRCKPFSYNLAGVFDMYRRPKLAAGVVKKLFGGKS